LNPLFMSVRSCPNANSVYFPLLDDRCRDLFEPLVDRLEPLVDGRCEVIDLLFDCCAWLRGRRHTVRLSVSGVYHRHPLPAMSEPFARNVPGVIWKRKPEEGVD
jgi:hypothetical protein